MSENMGQIVPESNAFGPGDIRILERLEGSFYERRRKSQTTRRKLTCRASKKR